MTDRETLLEAAALGALDALSPADREALAAGLQAAPEAAAEARQLAEAAALLALAAPPQPLPPAAWAGIAAALPPQTPAARVIPFPRRLRDLVRGGWAVAAGLALGWAAHGWWAGRLAVDPSARQVASVIETPNPAPPSAGGPATGNSVATPDSPTTVPTPPPPAVSRDTEALLESRRLQAEVRLLSSRAAELTRQLEEAAILPPATTPLHVFQLSLTNLTENGGLLVLRPRRDAGTDETAVADAGVPLTEALALAAAGALTATTDDTGATPASLFAPDAPLSVLGFVSPATGKGAVVVHLDQDSGVPAGSTITLSQAGGSGAPVAVLAHGVSSGSTLIVPFVAADGVSLTGPGAGGFIVTVQPPVNAAPPPRPPGETPAP